MKDTNMESKLKQKPQFGDCMMPCFLTGAGVGLVTGILLFFIPLPQNLFQTIGACFKTLTATGAGIVAGLCFMPLALLGARVYVKLWNKKYLAGITARMADNPIVQQVIHEAAQSMAAVIVTRDSIRLYDRIVHGAYCQEEKLHELAATQYDLHEKELHFQKPEHWAAYDQPGACKQEFRFDAMGYEALDEDAFVCLGDYLLEKLGAWEKVEHLADVKYTSYSGGGFTGEITYNTHTGRLRAEKYKVGIHEYTSELYRDYFIFRSTAKPPVMPNFQSQKQSW